MKCFSDVYVLMPVAFGVAEQIPEPVLLLQGFVPLPVIICDDLAPRRQSRLEPCAFEQMGTLLHLLQSLYGLCGPHGSPLQCLLFGVPMLERNMEKGKKLHSFDTQRLSRST